MLPFSRPKLLIYITYPRVNPWKPPPFTAAPTYIAHMLEYPQPPPQGDTVDALTGKLTRF